MWNYLTSLPRSSSGPSKQHLLNSCRRQLYLFGKFPGVWGGCSLSCFAFLFGFCGFFCGCLFVCFLMEGETVLKPMLLFIEVSLSLSVFPIESLSHSTWELQWWTYKRGSWHSIWPFANIPSQDPSLCCQWQTLKSEIWTQAGLGRLQVEIQPPACQTNTLTDYAVTLSLWWCAPAAQMNELPLFLMKGDSTNGSSC